MNFIQSNRTLLLTLLIVALVLALLAQGISTPTLVSILLSGLTLGALYFLVAGGLTLIFGLMDVLNFAHGSLFMLGAYSGWTFYTNPRLILNTAPLFLLFAAGLALNPSVASRIKLPRVARWMAAIVAAAILLFAVRDFPLDKLVAFGTTVSGQVIPTAQAQEPLTAMWVRLALMFVAGAVL